MGCDLLAVRFQNNIARENTRQISRFSFDDALNQRTGWNAGRFGHVRRHGAHRNADAGTFDISLRDQHLHDLLHLIDRKRKTNSLCADGISHRIISGGNGLCTVDANDFALHIDQRAAAVAKVDCGVCLKIGVRIIIDGHFALVCADNAVGNRIGQFVR
ncbi:hypothetical protein SDC9_190347 [bioreactor metagenome]|uniref:Uncharacterized protein n=1 Tax=bioreactor metagenome TaxID=1076179 RepID=A0A645HX75_9ZZZZ